MIFSFVSLFELALLVIGSMLLLYRWGYGIAHALSLSIVISLMALSLIFQAAFLVGVPELSYPLEGALVVGSVVMIFKERHRLIEICVSLFQFMRCYSVMSGVVVLCIAYLGLQAIVLPEGNYDSMRYNLTRVLLFQQERSMLLTNVTEYHQAVFPVGGDILSHLFLRYYTDYGLATIRFLAYLSIGFGSYALSRNHASSNVAWTVMLIVISFPLLVRQATGTKPDIMATSVVVLCFLCAERLLSRPNLRDGLLVVLGLGFGMSIKTTFLAFLIPFFLLFACSFLKRHGVETILRIFRQNRLWVIIIVPAVLVFSQLWLFLHNYNHWGHWSGPTGFVNFHKNQDGLLGTVANLLRYAVQCLHLMTPTDIVSSWMGFGFVSDMFERAYELLLYPVIGDSGAAWHNNVVSFSLSDLSWGDSENGAWFGPFGFFFVIPALVYTIICGSTILRMTSIVLVIYTVVLSWQLSWMPWNCRYFGPVFVGGAGCLGYWLSRWQTLRRLQSIQILSLAILVYCCAINQAKVVVGAAYLKQSIDTFTFAPGLFEQGIWSQTNWGRDRFYYARRYYGNNRVNEFIQLVKPNARVAVMSANLGWLFHYMLYRPDIHFVPLSEMNTSGKALSIDLLKGFDYLLCINRTCDELPLPAMHELLQEYKPEKDIWDFPLGEYVRPGGLIRL
jgi:hypothetical protein